MVFFKTDPHQNFQKFFPIKQVVWVVVIRAELDYSSFINIGVSTRISCQNKESVFDSLIVILENSHALVDLLLFGHVAIGPEVLVICIFKEGEPHDTPVVALEFLEYLLPDSHLLLDQGQLLVFEIAQSPMHVDCHVVVLL